MAYQHWSYDTLHRLCMDAFTKFGFTEAEADIIFFISCRFTARQDTARRHEGL